MKGKSLPSPTIVVAILALVGAVAGTAVAGDRAATTSKLTKKKVASIADKEINKLAPGLSVAKAETATTATTATTAANATTATNAANAANATNAANANLLDGIDSTSLPQVFSGRADSSNGQVDTIFTVESMGVEILDSGGFVDNSAFQVKNARAPGGGNIVVDFSTNQDADGSQPVAPGNTSSTVSGKNGTSHGSPAFVTDPAALGRVLVIWCELGVTSRVTCLALLKG